MTSDDGGIILPRVVGIFVADAAGEPMRSLRRTRAVAGEGLEGDRYAIGRGHFSPRPRADGSREVTFIESEVLRDLEQQGITMQPSESRRNIISQGVRLNDLMGATFRLGSVTCHGIEPCHPCRHLERLTQRPVLGPLVGRGGLRARIVVGGHIELGDTIRA